MKAEGSSQVNKQGGGLQGSSLEPSPEQRGDGGSWLTWDPSRNLSELLRGQWSWHLYLFVQGYFGHLHQESCIVREGHRGGVSYTICLVFEASSTAKKK